MYVSQKYSAFTFVLTFTSVKGTFTVIRYFQVKSN